MVRELASRGKFSNKIGIKFEVNYMYLLLYTSYLLQTEEINHKGWKKKCIGLKSFISAYFLSSTRHTMLHQS